MTFPYLLLPPKRRMWTFQSPHELSSASPLEDFGPHDFEYTKKKDCSTCVQSPVHRQRIFNQGIALKYCIAVYMLYVLYVVFF